MNPTSPRSLPEPDSAGGELIDVAFPEMGDSVAEGTVLEWRVKPGDAVAVDDPLVEISTDKVDAEVPSPVAGTIAEVLVEADQTVSVGTILCRIAAGAGATPDAAGNGPVQPAAEPAEQPSPAPVSGNGADATPVAARIASAHGVDLASISGTGPRGRVTKEDVLAAVEGNGAAEAAAPAAAAGAEDPAGAHPAEPGAPARQPIRGPAATLVKFMNDSRSIPTATSFRTLPVDVLDARRKELKASGKKLSFTHLIAWAIVQAARDMPVMGNGYAEQDGKPQRVVPGSISLGLAVDVERKDGTRSLVVPVLRDASEMDFAAFAAQLRRAGRRRARQHAPARRLPGREHHADQPRRHRHRRERAAADARPGHDRRDRCDRLPARADRRRPRPAARARRPEGHDDDEHLRPPRHPGRGVGCLPAPDRRAAAG